MTFIICAFESEARAVIDKLKLNKKNNDTYKIFYNDETLLLITGMGQEKALSASEYLLLNFPPKKEDVLINLGVCAAQSTYCIGELIQVKKLVNEDESHTLSTLDSDFPTLSCFSAKVPLNRPVNEDIAEMEALSIYKSISPYFQKEKISFLKIVSDNFNPTKPNKQFIISLVQNKIPDIIKHIKAIERI